jgi:hypothetical protein
LSSRTDLLLVADAELFRPAADAAACSRRLQSRKRAFTDDIALELGRFKADDALLTFLASPWKCGANCHDIPAQSAFANSTPDFIARWFGAKMRSSASAPLLPNTLLPAHAGQWNQHPLSCTAIVG